MSAATPNTMASIIKATMPRTKSSRRFWVWVRMRLLYQSAVGSRQLAVGSWQSVLSALFFVLCSLFFSDTPMLIEIGTPCVLSLGLVRLREEGGAAMLGITLQHPPIHLFAQAAAGLIITGARADLAWRQAELLRSQWGGSPG